MTETITSTHNPRIRALRRLLQRRHREEEGLFIAEGEDLLAAALANDVAPRTVFSVPEPPPPLAQLLADLPAAVERVPATAAALEVAGSLGSGSRVIGVWDLPDIHLRAPKRAKHATLGRGEAPDIPGHVAAQDGPVLYLHDVADPGNVGTVLRAARAFAAPLVVLSERTADPFGPKAVRASMGAVFGQPLVRSGLPAARDALDGHRAIALVPGAGVPLREADLDGPVLFVLGAEREGLPPAAVEACDSIAHVPVDRAATDSLNVAMTATLCLYEYLAHHG
jgi:TrmH family RNA methyltransferase